MQDLPLPLIPPGSFNSAPIQSPMDVPLPVAISRACAQSNIAAPSPAPVLVMVIYPPNSWVCFADDKHCVEEGAANSGSPSWYL